MWTTKAPVYLRADLANEADVAVKPCLLDNSESKEKAQAPPMARQINPVM